MLAFIVSTQLGGCSVRMFNIGDENSRTDRVDSLGFYHEYDATTQEKDK